jgi:hypothetical protein
MPIRNIRKYQYHKLAPGVFALVALLVCGRVDILSLGMCLFFAYLTCKKDAKDVIRSGKGIDPGLVTKAETVIQTLATRIGVESPGCQVRKMRSLASYDSIDNKIALSPR